MPFFASSGGRVNHTMKGSPGIHFRFGSTEVADLLDHYQVLPNVSEEDLV